MAYNNIKKVIYFIETPFDARDYERFGVHILIENNFEVQLWEFTPFLNPDGYKNAAIRQESNEVHRLFYSKKEALSAISNLDSFCFIICLIILNARSFSIFRLLSKQDIKYCVFRANALPLPPRVKNNFNFMLNKSKNLNALKIMDLLLSRFPYTQFGLKPATLLLAGGEKSLSYRYPMETDAEILWLHAFDYDIYLNKTESVQVNSNLVVFLDEYLPFHSDYIYLNLKPYATPEEYYPLICRFFDKIEKIDNIKVAIAVHPRSDYEKHDDLYDGRLIIKNRTFELVRESKFVIAHCSTAINFAVLCRKPIIFITTNHLNKTIEGQTIDIMAQTLGKKPINIDEQPDIDLEKELKVNEKLYDQYINDYIKKRDSEENYFWQIVAERLKDGFNKN